MKQSSVIKLAFRQKVPRAPQGLGKVGKRLWRLIQAEYSITDPAGLAFLLTASRCEDDIVAWRATVAEQGAMIEVVDKPSIAHPLLAAIGRSESVKRAAIRALNLDLAPQNDRVGRPSGR
ncbi:MAG: hypothetical protein U1E51_21310 [Candidatus Binatia bacterium]|nr:hypothetical protein [Candidatus Binatia bacterium]